MKHIKVFEEFFGGDNSLENKDKIEDLIQLCFAELTDEDFRIVVSERNISISKMNSINDIDRLFNYNMVEDHLIPFVKLLSKDYDIDHIFFLGDWKKKSWLDKKIEDFKGIKGGSRERKEVSVEDLISDKAKINFQLISITIKRIRQKNKELPIIFLTARDTTQETIDGIKAGANDYIKKTI